VKTNVLRVEAKAIEEELLAQPAKLVRSGEVVGFPTETVYGLAARADREDSLDRLRQLKGRAPEHPFTVHLADADALEGEPVEISPVAHRLIQRCWPGPLTLVLPRRDGGAVGYRMPNHEVARAFLGLVGGRVVGTSANPTGEAPAVDAEGVLAYFDGRIPCLIDSGPARFAQASTVVRVESKRYEILRQGALSEEKVRRAASVVILLVCTGNACRSPMATFILKQLIADRLDIPVDEVEQAGYTIVSAGTVGGFGGATPEAVQVIREMGGDISGHLSAGLGREMVEHADHIVAMTESHLRRIVALLPEARERTLILDVADPIGGDVTVYRECANLIKSRLGLNLKRLLE
jgi:protein-tyrosine phosphatase